MKIKLLFTYQEKKSYLHSCDPISKIIWLLCFSILTIVITRAVPQFTLLILVILIGLFMAKISVNEIGLIILIFTGLSLGWFIIQSLLIGGDTIIFHFGPFIFAKEGVDAAGAVAFRTIILVSMARIFIGTTEPRDLALNITQKLKIPYTFAFGIFLMMRLLPLFEQEYREFQDAKKVRDISKDRGVLNAINSLKDNVTALLVRGFRRSVITSYSLECRAFRAYPSRTYLKNIEFTSRGIFLCIISITITLLAITSGYI